MNIEREHYEIEMEYYKSGQLKSEVVLKNKKRHGLSKSYHENGQLESEEVFKNGTPEGAVKKYDENGKQIHEETMNEDALKRNTPDLSQPF